MPGAFLNQAGDYLREEALSESESRSRKREKYAQDERNNNERESYNQEMEELETTIKRNTSGFYKKKSKQRWILALTVALIISVIVMIEVKNIDKRYYGMLSIVPFTFIVIHVMKKRNHEDDEYAYFKKPNLRRSY